MDLTRRGFLGATATAARIPSADRGRRQDDPLGVRRTFRPCVITFLNTAYTGLIPQAVVDAAREWIETRAGRAYTVGEMLAKADEARQLYAGMIGAGEDEIAFLSSTTEGENIVVNSLDFKAGDNVVYDDLVYPSTPVIYQRLAETRGRRDSCRQEPQRRRPGRGLQEAGRRHGRGSSRWRGSINNSGYRHDMKALGRSRTRMARISIATPCSSWARGRLTFTPNTWTSAPSGTYKWLMAGFGVAAFFVRRELLDKCIRRMWAGGRRRPGRRTRSQRRREETRVRDAGLR